VLGELNAKEVEPLASVRRNLESVNALAIALESGCPSEASFKALVDLQSRIQLLSANSSAQFYIWLRHFAEFGRGDIFTFEETCQLLLTPHVDALLAGDQLLSYLKIRLATCQLCAKSLGSHHKLTRAIAVVETQKKLKSPIKRSAVEDAEAAIRSAVAELTSNIDQLNVVEKEAEKLNLNHEIWSCCMERGGTRKLAGTALLRNFHDPSAKETWLRPSLADYRRGIEVAGPVTSPMTADLVLKPATTALTIARSLGDDAAIAEFTAIIDDVRATGLYDEQIAKQEHIESLDPLLEQVDDRKKPFLTPNNEKGIQDYTDLMMSSTGFPAERREYVEDDVRKIARIEEIQYTYCEHLQPLQNLKHLDSPNTAYTSKTKYVAACSLLGYEMSIEVDDIETTINAMKSVHCNVCPHRHPRRPDPPSDSRE
jgi:hypothetical protein